jgi:hypothetical protein
VVALYADGDSCTTVGDRYTLASADLTCIDNSDGKRVWMTKSAADQLQAQRDAAAEAKRQADAAAAQQAAAQQAAAQQAAAQQAAQQAAAQQAAQQQAAQQQAPQPQAPANVYYANCTAARAAGAAPIYRGQPGYRPALDRDNDGVACE